MKRAAAANGNSLWARLNSRWDGFWYAEGNTLALGLFRVFFGLAMLREIGVTRARSVAALADNYFHLPYLPFIPLVPMDRYHAIHNLELFFAVLLVLGLFRRTTCTALLILQGWVFFADQLNFRNHPYFFLLLLLALLLAPSSDALSLGGALRARLGRRSVRQALLGSVRPLTYQRLIQVELALVYVYAALHKLEPAFLDGRVLSHYLSDSLPRQAQEWLGLNAEIAARLHDYVADPSNLVGMAVATVVLELALPLGLFWRRLRPWAIAIGIPFHLGIAAMMNIWNFSWVMLAAYLLFLEPETLPRWGRRLLRLPPDSD